LDQCVNTTETPINMLTKKVEISVIRKFDMFNLPLDIDLNGFMSQIPHLTIILSLTRWC